MYIVIEGQDGTGKSTQARLLADYFKNQGREVAVMDEPDGDLPQAHEIHDLILVQGKKYGLEPMTNVLLFTSARLELWRKIAEPILKRGGVVISARNYWSTIAYQGYGEGVSRNKIIKITKDALPDKYYHPDKSIILTVSDKIRLERQGNRGKATETFEAKVGDFQQRVNSAYPKIAKDFNIPIIDASGTIEEVFDKIINLLSLQ
ncbi:dTMP kinase [Candidatus Saccharibacteria bacterium]|nr:dTMP kinase [Candidatus Saccharibacteria bacterium]